MTTVDGLTLSTAAATNANLTMTMTDEQIAQTLSGATNIAGCQRMKAAE